MPSAEQVRQVGLPKVPATSFDPLLDTLISAADAVLARRCFFPRNEAGRYSLDLSDYVQFYSDPEPDEPVRLDLGLRPIGELAEVAVDTQADRTYATVADLDEDLDLDGARGRLYLRPLATWTWPCGRRGIRVSCSAGVDVATDESLVVAIGLTIAHWVAIGQAGTLAVSQTIAGQSASYRDTGVPAAVREILGPYTLWERETHWRHR